MFLFCTGCLCLEFMIGSKGRKCLMFVMNNYMYLYGHDGMKPRMLSMQNTCIRSGWLLFSEPAWKTTDAPITIRWWIILIEQISLRKSCIWKSAAYSFNCFRLNSFEMHQVSNLIGTCLIALCNLLIICSVVKVTTTTKK